MANGYNRPSNYGGFSFFPPVLKNLLIINGAVFFLMMVLRNVSVDGTPGYAILMRHFALMPLGQGFEPWQLITYQFLHGGFSHILFNMFALWMFGMEIEQTMGSRKFLIFYLASGVGGGLAQLFIAPLVTGLAGPTVGASAAIFGVLIAFGLLFPDRYIIIYLLIPVKAKYLIAIMLFLNLYAIGDGSNVAYLAHIAGGLTGFLFMVFDKNIHFDMKNLFRSKKRPKVDPFGGSLYPGDNDERDMYTSPNPGVQDAKFYDIKDTDEITQADIDAILDKISRDGYKNLSEREKKILFEVSKRMN